MLRIENLRLGPLPSLTFEVADGECLSVQGVSGSGKTRLLRAIADLDVVDGFIFLDGAERLELPAPQWRRQVRYVSAEPSWWGETARTAFGPVAAENHRLERQLEQVGLSSSILDRELTHLSTGERSRLAFVRALQDEPKVLLLDEPTAALDPASAALVEEQIRFQLLAGRIVILATHDSGLSQRLSHARLMLPKPRGTAVETAGGDGL